MCQSTSSALPRARLAFTRTLRLRETLSSVLLRLTSSTQLASCTHRLLKSDTTTNHLYVVTSQRLSSLPRTTSPFQHNLLSVPGSCADYQIRMTTTQSNSRSSAGDLKSPTLSAVKLRLTATTRTAKSGVKLSQLLRTFISTSRSQSCAGTPPTLRRSALLHSSRVQRSRTPVRPLSAVVLIVSKTKAQLLRKAQQTKELLSQLSPMLPATPLPTKYVARMNLKKRLRNVLRNYFSS